MTLRFDRFADRMLIDGLRDFGPFLEDAAINRLRLLIEQRFHFLLSKEFFFDVIVDTARLNAFHPVKNYLADLHWDGVKRIDTWLTSYGGAENTEYVRAIGRLILVAAVRRVRAPGCQFDEMVVIEQPIQGTNKSTALRILAVNEDWFSDDPPMNAKDSRGVIEALRGRWINEVAEFKRTNKDVNHNKAFLSRRTDRGRLVWDRTPTEVPRQCIFVGTTNEYEYFTDTTGNRRYWPVRIVKFDLKKLRQDRDQLWAEAAAAEATGESIRLDQKLWPKAEEEQTKRLIEDPYKHALEEALDGFAGKISSASVWTILDIKPGHLGQAQAQRINSAMRDLGWVRPNKSGMVAISGAKVYGFVKGEQPWATVVAERREGRLHVLYDTVPPESGQQQPKEGQQHEMDWEDQPADAKM